MKTSFIITSIILVSACGGGSDPNNSNNNTTPTKEETIYTLNLARLTSTSDSSCTPFKINKEEKHAKTSNNATILIQDNSGTPLSAITPDTDGTIKINQSDIPDNGYVTIWNSEIGLSFQDHYALVIEKSLMSDYLINLVVDDNTSSCISNTDNPEEKQAKLSVNFSNDFQKLPDIISIQSGLSQQYATQFENQTFPFYEGEAILLSAYDSYDVDQSVATELSGYELISDPSACEELDSANCESQIVTIAPSAVSIEIEKPTQCSQATSYLSVGEQSFVWQQLPLDSNSLGIPTSSALFSLSAELQCKNEFFDISMLASLNLEQEQTLSLPDWLDDFQQTSRPTNDCNAATGTCLMSTYSDLSSRFQWQQVDLQVTHIADRISINYRILSPARSQFPLVQLGLPNETSLIDYSQAEFDFISETLIQSDMSDTEFMALPHMSATHSDQLLIITPLSESMKLESEIKTIPYISVHQEVSFD